VIISCNTDELIYIHPVSAKWRVICYSIGDDYSMTEESEVIVSEKNNALITAYGNYLYVADSNGVSDWNYKNPSSPFKSDFYRMDGCNCLCLAGGYLFASNGESVKIFKVLSTGKLLYKSVIDLSDIYYVVENNGTYYLSSRSSIYIYKLNFMEEFEMFSSVRLVEYMSYDVPKIVISNNHLFLTSDEYDDYNVCVYNSLLQVYEINDDGSLNFIGINSMNIEFIWLYEPVFAVDFDFIDGDMYVSNLNIGLLKYSLKDGYIPEFQGIVESGYQTALLNVDSLHYLSLNNTTSMKMMLSRADGFKVIDENKYIAFCVVNVDTAGDYQILSSIDGKLIMFDGSICEENLISAFNIEGLIMSTFKYEDYLFVLSPHKFYVLDYSEPTLPIIVDSVNYNNGEWMKYRSAEVINGLLFIGNDSWHEEAEVFDISDMHNILYKTTLYNLTGFAKCGNYLLSNTVYDISDTSNIYEVNWINEYNSDKARIYGNYLFTIYWGGMKLFDVTSPLAPVELYLTDGYFLDFEIKDTLLYLLQEDPLQAILYSIKDPGAPVCLDSIAIESNGVLNTNANIIPDNDGFIVKNIGALSYSINQITGCEIADVKESDPLLIIEGICTHNELKMVYSGSEDALSYEIMDVSGRIVMKNNLKVISGNEIRVNVEKLNSGIYLLKVNTEQSKIKFKIIKL
jgi:hypothetical protein